MVQLQCLDDDETDDEHMVQQVQMPDEGHTLNSTHGFSAALRCYP